MSHTATLPPPSEAPAGRRLPGDLAIWVFILSEMLVFAVFFAAYAFARANNVELFNEYQQTVNRDLGALNTFLLITGSWFVVRAVQAAHRDDLPAVPRNILLGFLCGGGFLVVKVIEYAANNVSGNGWTTAPLEVVWHDGDWKLKLTDHPNSDKVGSTPTLAGWTRWPGK